MARELILITGEINSGKTSFLNDLTQKLLTDADLETGGFLARGILEGNEKTGYELTDIRTARSSLICTSKPVEGWEKVRKFYFNPEAFSLGEKILQDSGEARVVIVDEFGPLELAGGGWKTSIEKILEHTRGYLILSVRKSLLTDTVYFFKGHSMHIYSLEQGGRQLMLESITRLVN